MYTEECLKAEIILEDLGANPIYMYRNNLQECGLL